MEDNTNDIINYFKKLQRVVSNEADITLFRIRLIKKNKIDDILCCILAKLPDSYKKMMHASDGNRYSSILSYNLLFKILKRKFALSSDMYLIDANKAGKLIDTIIKTISRDIKYIAKND